MGKHLLIAIPAFNEERNIEKVLLEATGIGDVCVFDNLSTDNTKKIAISFGSKVVAVNNKGYENVILKIVNKFLNSDYEKLIIIDGDGEVGIGSIEKVNNLLNKYDAVLGKRDSIKRWSEKLVCFLFKKFYGIEDIYVGFKGFRKSGLSKKPLRGTFATSIVNKKSKICNFEIAVQDRNDNSKLGNSVILNFKLLIGGLKGFFF